MTLSPFHRGLRVTGPWPGLRVSGADAPGLATALRWALLGLAGLCIVLMTGCANPAFVPAYVLRGLVYMRLNEPVQAEDSFRRALQINAKDADALHNYGWFACQRGRHAEAIQLFTRALASPVYGGQAKTLMAKGVCQTRMGQLAEAESSFSRSYELDAANPITGFNLAQLLFKRGDNTRAQFYIRRLNNSELANAESLWLGIKVERALNNMQVVDQLAQQLMRRFPKSPELASFQRGAFHE